MPDVKPPSASEDQRTKDEWIERLLDGFCFKHKLLDRLVGHLAANRLPA